MALIQNILNTFFPFTAKATDTNLKLFLISEKGQQTSAFATMKYFADAEKKFALEIGQ